MMQENLLMMSSTPVLASGTLVLLVVVGGVVFILFVLLMFVIGIYNKLVKFRERVKNAFAQIDVQLQRRHDLIPNLVEVAKKYMSHEQETLTAVVEARAKATSVQVQVQDGDMSQVGALAQAEGQLNGALGRLLASFEAYPDLKADGQMQQLTEELTTTENKVAFSRQGYNDSVTAYHTYKQTFPPVLLAGVFGFQDASYYEVEDEAVKQAPTVQF